MGAVWVSALWCVQQRERREREVRGRAVARGQRYATDPKLCSGQVKSSQVKRGSTVRDRRTVRTPSCAQLTSSQEAHRSGQRHSSQVKRRTIWVRDSMFAALVHSLDARRAMHRDDQRTCVSQTKSSHVTPDQVQPRHTRPGPATSRHIRSSHVTPGMRSGPATSVTVTGPATCRVPPSQVVRGAWCVVRGAQRACSLVPRRPDLVRIRHLVRVARDVVGRPPLERICNPAVRAPAALALSSLGERAHGALIPTV
jgi:hypothetical protein